VTDAFEVGSLRSSAAPAGMGRIRASCGRAWFVFGATDFTSLARRQAAPRAVQRRSGHQPRSACGKRGPWSEFL